jgi:hypothetical protein
MEDVRPHSTRAELEAIDTKQVSKLIYKRDQLLLKEVSEGILGSANGSFVDYLLASQRNGEFDEYERDIRVLGIITSSLHQRTQYLGKRLIGLERELKRLRSTNNKWKIGATFAMLLFICAVCNYMYVMNFNKC